MTTASRLALAAAALLLSACATTPGGLAIDRSHVSVAQDSRALFLVLHYTAIDFPKSLKVLTTGGQVSAHYLVRDEPAEIYQLVDENRRAWHAGVSTWSGHTNLNSSSIGIEIVHPGYTDTPEGRIYAPYPTAQIDQVIALSKDIVARHQIKPERIIGHADIAPGRKQDPGPTFPWRRLALEGLIAWPDAAQVDAKRAVHELAPPDAVWWQERLGKFGYGIAKTGQFDVATREVIATFQMKYRNAKYDGQPDGETAALLDVATTPGGMVMLANAVPDPAAKAYRSGY